MAESKSRRRPVGPKAVAVAATAAIIGALLMPSKASQAADAVKIVGYMESVSSSDLHRMLIDPELNLGATLGNSGGNIILYDLEKLERIDIPAEVSSVPQALGGINPDRAVMDEKNHRIFFTPGNFTDLGYSGCASGPNPRFVIGVFDLINYKWSGIPMKCTSHTGGSSGNADQFKAQGVSYYAPTDRLYVAGTGQADWFAHQRGNTHTYDRSGMSLLVRQVDPSSGNVDWEIDLRGTGCDRMVNQVGGENVGSFVARFGNSLYSYCYGVRTSLQGDQGFAVKIPLEGDRYKTENGRPVVQLTPTLPNDLFPMLDPVSGNILMLTSGSPNGDAVWVFDPERERFVGVIASGVSAISNQSYTAAGLDVVTGRTYMLSTAGLLVADARHRPLPSGLNFKLGLESQKSGPVIASAPKLHRLFMPVLGYKYVVIEDNIPKPAVLPLEDPDAGTANVPEIEGETISSFSGASAGFGARLLVTGGITRAINNLDYSCYNDGLEQTLKNRLGRPVIKDANGHCIADQILTGGTRDLYLGPSQVELGSQTGAVAYASGAAFSSADTASDHDLKRISSCYSETFEDRAGQPPPAAYATTCSSFPFSRDFASGTRGPEGQGAPIPASTCGDFGGTPSRKTQPSTPAYAAFFGSSDVECDADAKKVTAMGIANGFAYPMGASPTVSIARAWSTTSSKVTASGTITTIESVATGINIGPYSIGRVSLSATTRAHGTAGTAGVNLSPPVISFVSGPNINCTMCDYRAVVDAMNRGLGLKMRITQPAAEVLASPLGYQSYVIKDPAARDSDRAANSDDTFAVPALQVVVYNDGHDGRNRFILQLSAVQAESRYGTVPLPEVGEGTFLPEVQVLAESVQSSSEPLLLGTQDSSAGNEPIVTRILRAPAQFVEEAVRLIVHNPREFMVLFVLWSLLAAPLYLWLRRRSLLREVSA